MFQSFAFTSDPTTGIERLSALRSEIGHEKMAGFLVPRGDVYQGENVAPCDERLAWLTGFTGSAGLCAALLGKAGVFIDSRYSLAVRSQIDLSVFEPVKLPEVKLADWLIAALPLGGEIGFDPWLHGRDEVRKLADALTNSGITLRSCINLVDRIWPDRPAPPMGPVSAQGGEYAGEDHQSKRSRIAEILTKNGITTTILTSPESLAWLLNIRGSDVARTPVPHGLALLQNNRHMVLFIEPGKLDENVRAHLGNEVKLAAPTDFGPALDRLSGLVGVDEQTAPNWVCDRLEAAGVAIKWMPDPCILPMATKNETELAGARAAHRRDGSAMANFLAWLASEAPKGGLNEIDVVTRLEEFRRETGLLRDISFNTICGSGPNGAIVHYRVSVDSNRKICPGEVLLVDSGAQYLDGTTDITRTLAVGPVNAQAAHAFTLVLKGMIAISRARWPVGLIGRDLDSFARAALWQAGLDYDHGTGHGVGSFGSVHEGPQGISRRNTTVLEAGMIVSNEPGYYREGAFGIRIENLVVVEPPTIPAGGDRAMHSFETLTLVPIDRAMIVSALLDSGERAWLDGYHAKVLREIGPLVEARTRDWLAGACAMI